MKVLMAVAPEQLLEERKRTGAHQWDEMWEGVLHVPPMATYDHQDLATALLIYLSFHWARPRKAKVLLPLNLAPVGGWPDDYRIPDLVLITPARFGIIKGPYCEGAPDVVVEIRSPEDESYDKLPFYLKLGVPEVWIIDRDTKQPEIHLLKRGRYHAQAAGEDGWVRSPSTGIDMKAGRRGKLAIRMNGEDSTLEEIPAD